MAVIAGVSFPTGKDSVGTNGVDPFVKLAASRNFKDGWSVGAMQSLFYDTEDGRRNPTWQSTLSVEREITGRSAVFVEYAGDFPRTGGTSQVLHFRIGIQAQAAATD